ncbi:unnamed protein product, partial [Polarella glacialis]
ANGWEIVPPIPSRVGRSSFVFLDHGEKVSCRPDELPEDLVMGCLDPECNALFGEGCDRHRCGSCRSFFCRRHLLGPWHLNFGGMRSRSSSGDNSGVVGRESSGGFQNGALPESLGLLQPGPVVLCRECHADLPLPLPTSSPAAASNARAGSVTGSPPRQLALSEAAALAAETQVLRSMPFATLSLPEEKEDASRASARLLMLR